MLQSIDLRELAELESAERAFLSLYVSSPEALGSLDRRAEKVRRLLAGEEAELEHFEENLRLVRETLEESSFDHGLALFACWALDYVKGFPLDVATPDCLWVDSAPYIRPLAEMQDEHERFLVLTADNDATRIHLVTEHAPQEVERVKGGVKNRVKKGGWSQKRYQRRREQELLHYAKEVADVLEDLVSDGKIERVVFLGQPEALDEIREHLSKATAEKVVAQESMDTGRDPEEVVEKALPLAIERERQDERSLWDRIRAESLEGGLAAVGPGPVLAAAQEGRVDEVLVLRDLEVSGMRCRDCELLAHAKPQQCPRCDSTSVFEVDLVNEIVEILERTSAHADFADPIPGLEEVGGIAALLRY